MRAVPTRMVDAVEPGGRLDQDLLSAAIGTERREIVFSSASELVPGDTNDAADLFVRDLP